MQENHSDCYRVAQEALVLGSSDHVKSDPIVPAPFSQLAHSTIQSDSTQESNLNLHAMAPQQSRSRVSLRQWQHELRPLKKDQPD